MKSLFVRTTFTLPFRKEKFSTPNFEMLVVAVRNQELNYLPNLFANFWELMAQVQNVDQRGKCVISERFIKHFFLSTNFKVEVPQKQKLSKKRYFTKGFEPYLNHLKPLFAARDMLFEAITFFFLYMRIYRVELLKNESVQCIYTTI